MTIKGSGYEKEYEKTCNTLGDRQGEILGLTELLMQKEQTDQEEVIARLNDLNKESFDLQKPTPSRTINDMTIEELRSAVRELIDTNQKLNKSHEEYANNVLKTWNDKKRLKARYLELRDRTVKK